MTNTEPMKVTLKQNGKEYTYTFEPYTLLIEPLTEHSGILHAFELQGAQYYLHNEIPHETFFGKVKSIASRVSSDVNAFSKGSYVFQGQGKKGVFVGGLAAAGLWEIVSHLPEKNSPKGYYNNGQKYFEGPVKFNIN